MTIHELQTHIPVYCKGHGLGRAVLVIDYGLHINTVWVIRLKDGRIKHFFSEDIRIMADKMNGESDDIPKDWL